MQPGDVVADRFVLEALAGSGGMGSVFRARDLATGATVALKLLRYEAVHAARFKREAELLATLDHPGIVRYVSHGGPPAYMAMEWLEGDSLRKRLNEGALSIADSVSVIRQSARALAVAHRRGVVHRDIKPENLFLVEGNLDQVKVLDFGVALARGIGQRMTRTGTPMGTIGYMSPEQVRGDHDLDARADVFALGEVLFECLSGQAPFAANHPLSVLAKIVFEEAPRIAKLRPDVPAALDELVAEMLSKDRRERPHDAEAIAARLTSFGPIEAPSPSALAARSRALTSAERAPVTVVVGADPIALGAATLLLADFERREQELRRVAELFGGHFQALGGSSLVMIFSARAEAGELAARAARAALALERSMPDVRLALATGHALVTGNLPLGDVIDRAALLLESESIQGIALDRASAGLLPSRFQIREADGRLTLVAEREAFEPARRLLGKDVPCVGRERELRTLEALFDECKDEPVARAMLVTGPPGIGKSRIRAELVHALTRRDAPVEVWIGRGDPLTAGAPFALVAHALRSAFALTEGDLASAHETLRARAGRHLQAERAEHVAQFLGELVGAPFPDDASVQLRAARRDPILMRDQVELSFKELIDAECGAHPLLLVLEDLHWGDLPSVKIMDFVLRMLPESPLCVLGIGRPEVRDLFPGLWVERDVQELRVRELPRRAALELARHALGGDRDPAALDALVTRASGNALFLEELVRADAEGRSELPESVLAMMQARVESLEPEARRLLRAASVFGESFWKSGLAQLVADLDPILLTEWLSVLSDRELFSAKRESRYPGESEFAFRHALVRDASYSMLTETDRELGHRLAAAWLEAKGERDATLLAEHYEKGGERRSAVPYWQRAAAAALDANDFERALGSARRGAEAGASGPSSGELELVSAEALRWSGKLSEAAERLSHALELLPRGSPRWHHAAAEHALLLQRLGYSDDLVSLARRLLAQSIRDPPSDSLAYALVRAALFSWLSGHSELAIELMDAVEHLEKTGAELEPRTRAQRHVFRGLLALYRSDLASYLGEEIAAERWFEEAGDHRRALNESGSIGYAYVELGAYDEAERVLVDALARARKMGLDHVAAAAEHNLGLVYAYLGKFTEAREHEENALRVFRAQEDRRLEGAALAYLAQIRLLGGDLDAAETTARQALDLVREVAPPIVPLVEAILARVRLGQSRATDALALARDANERAESLGSVEAGEALVRLVLAEALEQAGRHEDARAAIRVARSRLLDRADRIEDANLRRSFLEKVPENATTLALAASWLPDE